MTHLRDDSELYNEACGEPSLVDASSAHAGVPSELVGAPTAFTAMPTVVATGAPGPRAGAPSALPSTPDAPARAITRDPLSESARLPPAPLPAATLLAMVRDAIPRVGAEHRCGRDRVLVSAIWRQLVNDVALEVPLALFKRWLVSANRNGRLVLARVDRFGVTDARQLVESEIQDRGTFYHAVVDRIPAAAPLRA